MRKPPIQNGGSKELLEFLQFLVLSWLAPNFLRLWKGTGPYCSDHFRVFESIFAPAKFVLGVRKNKKNKNKKNKKEKYGVFQNIISIEPKVLEQF